MAGEKTNWSQLNEKAREEEMQRWRQGLGLDKYFKRQTVSPQTTLRRSDLAEKSASQEKWP